MPSDLPILPSNPVPSPTSGRSPTEKYGGLYWLGIGGLVVIVGLIGAFVIGMSRISDVLRLTYVLHDPRESLPTRVQAAYELSQDARTTDRQRWDMAIRTTNPPIARYVLAEGLTVEAVRGDVEGYALAVARSPGWPGWFRWLVFRPMVLRAEEDGQPSGPLIEEIRDALPAEGASRLWVAYFVLAGGADDLGLIEWARTAMQAGSEAAETSALVGLFDRALHATTQTEQRQAIADATLWMRGHDPNCRQVWDGWQVVNHRLVAIEGSDGERVSPPPDL